MRKLKSLKEFEDQQVDFSIENDGLRNIHGGGQTASKQPVSTDQGPDKDTDCGEEVTYDNGMVVVFIDKTTIE